MAPLQVVLVRLHGQELIAQFIHDLTASSSNPPKILNPTVYLEMGRTTRYDVVD
jgi:hypothetical protein